MNSLLNDYFVPLSLVFNADETSYQITPTIDKSWRSKDGSVCAAAATYKKIFKRHNFTTLLCCISASGDFLPPQINWKGKSERIKVNHQGVAEYLQHTHWSTVDSILNYVRVNILPRVRAHPPDEDGRPPRFIFLIDYAGVHISYEFRKRFKEEFGSQGILAFVPPNMTGSLQPLDVSVFGAFKMKAKSIHTSSLVEGAFEHTWKKEPQAYEFSTRQARETCVKSIWDAWVAIQKDLGRRSGGDTRLQKAWANVFSVDPENTVAFASVGDGASRCVQRDAEERKIRGFRRPKLKESIITFPFGHPVLDTPIDSKAPLSKDDAIEHSDIGPRPDDIDDDEDSDEELVADVYLRAVAASAAEVSQSSPSVARPN